MSAGHEQHHPYHLVDPSPWPLLGAIAGGVTALGIIFLMHEVSNVVLPIGIVLTLLTMFLWWRDVIKEAHAGHHTKIVQLGLRYGMILFIASEVMFFSAFFWAYFDASLFYDEVAQFDRLAYTGGVWPPEGLEVIPAFDLPLLNTMILLLSGCTITWAHHGLLTGDRQSLIQGLIITIVLGIFFTLVQAYEYWHAAFTFDGGIYQSAFYMATGFHGAHVIIGTCFLIVCLFRSLKGHFTPEQHFGFEAAAWYWHFVDVVWLFLFTFVYFFFGKA